MGHSSPTRWGRTLLVLLAAGWSVLVPKGAASASPRVGEITEFPVPSANSQPWGIATGPDGRLWFTEFSRVSVGAIDTSGVITEIPYLGSNTATGIATGADGNLWFTIFGGSAVIRLTPSGVATTFPIPTPGSGPYGISAGPDGNLWFTEQWGNNIGRITPSGVILEFPVPTGGSLPRGIAAGPDGNLWFTELTANKIGRMTTSGVVTEFPVPAPGIEPDGITAGPDGNLWFVEGSGYVGRITPSGTITQFLVNPAMNAEGITTGSDGNLWVPEFNGGNVARITPSGVVTEYPIPTPASAPIGIAPGVDGNLWFAEAIGNNIGRASVATPNKSYVVSLDSGFSRRSTTVPLGETVQWSFYGALKHTATDATGLGLFDSGLRSPVSFFTFAFTAAGSFPYADLAVTSSHRGRIDVPVEVPSTGTVGTPFTVTWASSSPPTGDVFDVQVRIPGSSQWTDWQDGVTAQSDAYTPLDPGTYGFRARLRNATGTEACRWSPVGLVIVS